jgi:hypothetical protein
MVSQSEKLSKRISELADRSDLTAALAGIIAESKSLRILEQFKIAAPLTDKISKRIAELADLYGCTFDDMASALLIFQLMYPDESSFRKRKQRSHSGSKLAFAFLNADGLLDVGRIAEHFGMSELQLKQTVGTETEAINARSGLNAGRLQGRATEMLEIVGRIADWAGGEKQAMAWYRAEPIAAFGGRTAESLVKEGKAAAVRDYLDHVATGGFA